MAIEKNQQITSFTKENCRVLRDALMEAMRPVATQFGVNLSPGRGRFDAVIFDLKIKAKVADPSVAEDYDRRQWEGSCRFYGLNPEHYGQTFEWADQQYQIMGINTKAHKMPISVIRLANRKRYRFPARFVQEKMAELEAAQAKLKKSA